MTDPTRLSETPFFMCDSYRLLEVDYQVQGIYDSESQWLVRARIIPDWTDEPVDFFKTVETRGEAVAIADEIERLAA